jgi:hypothetical protein
VAFAEEAGSGWLTEWDLIALVALHSSAAVKTALRFVRKQLPSDGNTCRERVGQKAIHIKADAYLHLL